MIYQNKSVKTKKELLKLLENVKDDAEIEIKIVSPIGIGNTKEFSIVVYDNSYITFCVDIGKKKNKRSQK